MPIMDEFMQFILSLDKSLISKHWMCLNYIQSSFTVCSFVTVDFDLENVAYIEALFMELRLLLEFARDLCVNDTHLVYDQKVIASMNHKFI